jgi:hypothetical protein
LTLFFLGCSSTSSPGDLPDASVPDAADAGAIDATVQDQSVDAPARDAATDDAMDSTVRDSAPDRVDPGVDAGPDVRPDANFSYDAPVRDRVVSPDSACATTEVVGIPVELPIDMYVMLDRSGTMGQRCNVGDTTIDSKWCHAINAISSYFKAADAGTTGNSAALQYFSLPGQSDPPCGVGGGYSIPAIPADGGLLGLPSANFDPSLSAQTPAGETPTEPALRGLIDFTALHIAPLRTMIGLLITDGDPSQCMTDPAALANLLRQHRLNTGIRTYIIGMTDANYTTLETLAIAGGGPSHGPTYCDPHIPLCHYWDVGNGDPSAFASALQRIQQRTAVPCSYSVPTTDAGIVDPRTLAVQYLQGGVITVGLTRVAGAASCAPNSWYFEDTDGGPSLTLCPDTCSMVQGDADAKMRVLVGCQGG